MKPGSVNKNFFQGRLAELGKSQAALARRLRVRKAAITDILNGERRVQVSELDVLADFLQISVEKATNELGLRYVKPRPERLPVMGHLTADDQVKLFTAAEIADLGEEIDAPFPGYSGVVLKVRGNAFAPRYKDGEILAFSPNSGDPGALLGKEAFVKIEGGPLVLKIIHEGGESGLYNLASIAPAAPPVANVRIEWASPIDWHIPG